MHTPSQRHARREWRIAVLLILVSSAASYLLLAEKLSFTSDDWYLIYAGLVGGFDKFKEVFAADRPFRAYFAWPVFALFGIDPQPYLFLSYSLRVAGALAFYWLVRQVWPKPGWRAVALGVLFVVYPGWTDQNIPLDIQSHLLGAALMLLSTALAVRALRASSLAAKTALVAGGVASQWIALSQMEYYIGIEGLRLGVLALLCFHRRPQNALRKGALAGWRRLALAWLPYGLSAGAFLFWRVALFENTRRATDIGEMLAGFTGSPVHRGLWSIVYLVQDFLNVTLLAWFIPLNQQAFQLRLRDAVPGLVLAAGIGGLAWLALRWLQRQQDDSLPGTEGAGAAGKEMFWVGVFAILVALAPVILGSRHIVFPAFSRFTLPASAGALLVLGGALAAVSSPRLQRRAAAGLVALAVLAHYGNAVQFAQGWENIRSFWWQVSWRAPQIAPETVLAAHYPHGGIFEDYFVWGPANQVFYPQRYRVDGIDRTPLAAVLLNNDNVRNIQLGREMGERERRGMTSTQDLNQLLLLSMPTKGACMHLLDGRAPELSDQEPLTTSLAAPYSRAERVLLDAPANTPPQALFGPEPPHDWCYYYQKASLARHRDDWQEVVRLGDAAADLGYRPVDRVEWMPFLQAYAYLGRYEEVDRLVPILMGLPYLRNQACTLFTADVAGYGKAHPEGQAYLLDAFCR
jgi:hypothetical protein